MVSFLHIVGEPRVGTKSKWNFGGWNVPLKLVRRKEWTFVKVTTTSASLSF